MRRVCKTARTLNLSTKWSNQLSGLEKSSQHPLDIRLDNPNAILDGDGEDEHSNTKPATGLYTKPDESSSHSQILYSSFKIHINIIFYLCLVFVYFITFKLVLFPYLKLLKDDSSNVYRPPNLNNLIPKTES